VNELPLHNFILQHIAGIVQIFIKPWEHIIYPRVIKVCRLHFESRHDFFLHVNVFIEIFPKKMFLYVTKEVEIVGRGVRTVRRMSNTSHLHFSRGSMVTSTVWGLALSLIRYTPRDNIQLFLFSMTRRSRVKVTQYTAALIVALGYMTSTRRTSFLSQKTDAIIFQ
jgi:hypothetical protein